MFYLGGLRIWSVLSSTLLGCLLFVCPEDGLVEEIKPKLDDDPGGASDEMPRDYPKHPCGGSPDQA